MEVPRLLSSEEPARYSPCVRPPFRFVTQLGAIVKRERGVALGDSQLNGLVLVASNRRHYAVAECPIMHVTSLHLRSYGMTLTQGRCRMRIEADVTIDTTARGGAVRWGVVNIKE